MPFLTVSVRADLAAAREYALAVAGDDACMAVLLFRPRLKGEGLRLLLKGAQRLDMGRVARVLMSHGFNGGPAWDDGIALIEPVRATGEEAARARADLLRRIARVAHELELEVIEERGDAEVYERSEAQRKAPVADDPGRSQGIDITFLLRGSETQVREAKASATGGAAELQWRAIEPVFQQRSARTRSGRSVTSAARATGARASVASGAGRGAESRWFRRARFGGSSARPSRWRTFASTTPVTSAATSKARGATSQPRSPNGRVGGISGYPNCLLDTTRTG